MSDVERQLESAGPGGAFRLPVAGRSLAPLLRPGDSIELRRCGADALRRGDLALIRRGAGWSVRVVAGIRPLRTALLRETPAGEAGDVHARVFAIRRGPHTIRFGAAMRALAWTLQRALAGGGARVLRSAAARWRATPPVRALRRMRTGPVRIRGLRAEDAGALDRFAAENLPRSRGLLARRLREGAAGITLGAFDRRGRLCAFAYLDEYAREGVELPGWWVRMLSTAPAARRLGLGRAIVRELCAEAERLRLGPVRADVAESNEPSLRLFRALGFRDAPGEISALANELLAPPPSGGRWVVLEHPGGCDPRP